MGLEGVRACRLTSSDAAQSKSQGLELPHCNICPIDEVPEHKNEPVLQIQNYRITLTQGNNWISERSPSEVLVLIK